MGQVSGYSLTGFSASGSNQNKKTLEEGEEKRLAVLNMLSLRLLDDFKKLSFILLGMIIELKII